MNTQGDGGACRLDVRENLDRRLLLQTSTWLLLRMRFSKAAAGSSDGLGDKVTPEGFG